MPRAPRVQQRAIRETTATCRSSRTLATARGGSYGDGVDDALVLAARLFALVVTAAIGAIMIKCLL